LGDGKAEGLLDYWGIKWLKIEVVRFKYNIRVIKVDGDKERKREKSHPSVVTKKPAKSIVQPTKLLTRPSTEGTRKKSFRDEVLSR
jgi:hypothetical protein